MARITGLTFIMPVRDLDRASAFYTKAFELKEVFRTEGIVFVGSEGSDSAIGLVLDPENAGNGPQNVGPHVDHALSPDDAVRDVEAAGGKIVERGEHAPDVPYARITDPDGNEFWI
jgi:predicted enzyme related to lactoylglutathione lyase